MIHSIVLAFGAAVSAQTPVDLRFQPFDDSLAHDFKITASSSREFFKAVLADDFVDELERQKKRLTEDEPAEREEAQGRIDKLVRRRPERGLAWIDQAISAEEAKPRYADLPERLRGKVETRDFEVIGRLQSVLSRIQGESILVSLLVSGDPKAGRPIEVSARVMNVSAGRRTAALNPIAPGKDWDKLHIVLETREEQVWERVDPTQGDWEWSFLEVKAELKDREFLDLSKSLTARPSLKAGLPAGRYRLKLVCQHGRQAEEQPRVTIAEDVFEVKP